MFSASPEAYQAAQNEIYSPNNTMNYVQQQTQSPSHKQAQPKWKQNCYGN